MRNSFHTSQLISVSIVSHCHGALVERLVIDLLTCPEVGQVLVTQNIPELLTLPTDARIQTRVNATPSGFAANQNAAFQQCNNPYFCPLNPDIQLADNPFPRLISVLQATDSTVVTPLIINPRGDVENNLRPFPTLRSLLVKVVGGGDDSYKLKCSSSLFYPDWVAGMFMLIRAIDFKRLEGFDEGFFLYYEDVDFCARAWKAGMKVTACPSVSVIHDARRTSHENYRYMCWHLKSMARYFFKHWGRLPTVPYQQ